MKAFSVKLDKTNKIHVILPQNHLCFNTIKKSYNKS